MSGVDPNRRRLRYEEWIARQPTHEVGCDTKFFDKLSMHRREWVLLRLYVSTGWEPPARLAMMDEQHRFVGGVDEHEVRDQMLGRLGRPLVAIEHGVARDPTKRVRLVDAFDRVARDDRLDERAHPDPILHGARLPDPRWSASAERQLC